MASSLPTMECTKVSPDHLAGLSLSSSHRLSHRHIMRSESYLEEVMYVVHHSMATKPEMNIPSGSSPRGCHCRSRVLARQQHSARCPFPSLLHASQMPGTQVLFPQHGTTAASPSLYSYHKGVPWCQVRQCPTPRPKPEPWGLVSRIMHAWLGTRSLTRRNS